MYKIVQAPNEILRTPTKPVDLKMPELAKIIVEMKKILVNQEDPEGVGLAANQIGLPYRLFVTRTGVFINPEILEHSKEFQIEKKKSPLEGCLSLPKYYGVVKRWQWVKIRYQTLTDLADIDRNKKGSDESVHLTMSENVFSGFPAVVIQHEVDHLDGKIFVERILEQQGSLYKVTGKNWEEVEL